jgi:hypothetical protein
MRRCCNAVNDDGEHEMSTRESGGVNEPGESIDRRSR